MFRPCFLNFGCALQHPRSRGITEIRTPMAPPEEGPYFSNDPLLGVNPTHKVGAENFSCIWRTHYLAEFLIGEWAFQLFSPSYLVGILPYVLSIIAKEMKLNFLPALYTRTPSEQDLTPKSTHWPKPGQAYFRENASLGWHYPHSNL